MRFIRRALAALVAFSCGCDPQAGGGYLGEPLATYDGYVSSSGTVRLDAAMLWQRGPPPSTGDQELATRARVDPGFPARFTLRLYQPPPAAARRTLAAGEVPYARANAAAVPYGIADAGVAGAGVPGPVPPNAAAYGIDPHHWIVYLPSDVPAGSLMEWWLSAALPAGFHLLSVASFDPACMTAAKLDACAAELAGRGVPDDGTTKPGTARSLCLAPYRLQVAPPGEQLVLDLGTVAAPPPAPGCPG